jgi:hypothetical protein
MLSLAFGRVISLVVDGPPADELMVGLALELAVGIWGIVSLRTYGKP